jgi:hypothetical protein
VAIGDLNGDGRPDLATADQYSDRDTVVTRDSTGAGWDAPIVAGSTGSGPVSVAIGDLNGDGRNDLATADPVGNRVTVINRDADNTCWDAPVRAGTVSSNNNPSSLATGDLNGDGRKGRPWAMASGSAVDPLTTQETSRMISCPGRCRSTRLRPLRPTRSR